MTHGDFGVKIANTCFSMAQMVTGTRFCVTLHVHCLSCMLWNFSVACLHCMTLKCFAFRHMVLLLSSVIITHCAYFRHPRVEIFWRGWGRGKWWFVELMRFRNEPATTDSCGTAAVVCCATSGC